MDTRTPNQIQKNNKNLVFIPAAFASKTKGNNRPDESKFYVFKIEKFENIKDLSTGSGSYGYVLDILGKVILSKNKNLNEVYSSEIKHCNSPKIVKIESVARQNVYRSEFIKKLQEENAIAKKLFFSKTETVVFDDDRSYTVMNKFGSQTLRHFLSVNNNLSEEKIALLFYRICQALNQQIHQNGYTHGDIKPDNIMIEEIDGNLKITFIDYGMTTETRLLTSSKARCRGTSFYMAPELFHSDQTHNKDFLSTKSDIHALAMTFAYAILGEEKSLVIAKKYKKNIYYSLVLFEDRKVDIASKIAEKYRDTIINMLDFYPKKRMDILECQIIFKNIYYNLLGRKANISSNQEMLKKFKLKLLSIIDKNQAAAIIKKLKNNFDQVELIHKLIENIVSIREVYDASMPGSFHIRQLEEYVKSKNKNEYRKETIKSIENNTRKLLKAYDAYLDNPEKNIDNFKEEMASFKDHVIDQAKNIDQTLSWFYFNFTSDLKKILLNVVKEIDFILSPSANTAQQKKKVELPPAYLVR